MGSDVTKLLETELRLSPQARAAMAGSLLESLDTVVEADAEGEWDREIARRLKDSDIAPARGISWSDARRDPRSLKPGLPLVLHPEAVEEATAARQWFAERSLIGS